MGSQGKVALVTGAGTGIGRSVAVALMQEGYSVVFAGRRREPLEAAAEAGREAAPAGVRALVVPTDVGDPASVKALFAKTQETFGRLETWGGVRERARVSAPSDPDKPCALRWERVVTLRLFLKLRHELADWASPGLGIAEREARVEALVDGGDATDEDALADLPPAAQDIVHRESDTVLSRLRLIAKRRPPAAPAHEG